MAQSQSRPRPFTLFDEEDGADKPQSQAWTQAIDARSSVFNNVHDRGYQMNNEVHGPLSQTNHTTINQYYQDTAKERQELADWLSPLNFRQTQSEVYGNWREGTGEWVLNDERFKAWQKGDVKTLWCPGIPGVGKTVLASYIINLLSKQHKNNNVAVIYIYCNYHDQARQTVYNLVASLLKQLVQDSTPTFERVRREYRSHREQKFSPTLPEIRNTLEKEIAIHSQVYVIVDALDEIPEDDSVRAELLDCLQSLGSRLLVTSRDIPGIGEALPGKKCMAIRVHDDDIRKYIQGRVRSGSNLTRLDRLLAKNPALKEKVFERLLAKAQGMFLLCRLHMDSLLLKLTPRDIQIALDHLPKGIDDAYDKTMQRINALDKAHRLLALKAIMLITYALRPLSARELQQALAFSSDSSDINDDDLVDEAIIMDICAGLVVVDVKSSVFRLVHYTIQEYFDRYSNWSFPDPHAEITNICLGVLSILPTKRAPLDGSSSDKGFSLYARENWGYHARGSVEETNEDKIQEFLGSDERVYNALNSLDYFPPSYLDGGSALHLCAFFGLARTIDHLLKNGVSGERRDHHGRTSLFIAGEKGHVEAVRLLLDRGYDDVNSKDENGWTPLSVAACEGHLEVIQLLMTRHDLDINVKDNSGRVPLSHAARLGKVDVIRLLLTRSEVEVNSKDGNHNWTPLWFAVQEGSVEIVKLLLTRDDVDVNSKDRDGMTPLSLAAQKKNANTELVELLLSREDIILYSLDVDLCIQLAFPPRGPYHKELAQLLLMRATTNLPVMPSSKLLWLAAWQGDERTVDLLLACDDIDVNIIQMENGTPPLWAAADRAMYQILAVGSSVDHEFSVDNYDGMRQRDIFESDDYYGLEPGTEATMKLLLARDDVDVNWRNEWGETLLHIAAETGCKFLVKWLLSRKDIHLNLQDENGDSPLHYAVRFGHQGVASLLVEQDNIALNLKNKTGHTPLHYAVILEDSVEQMLPHSVSSHIREAMVALLLAQDDIDVGLEDDDGLTPLMLARSSEAVGIVKLLEEYAIVLT